ncbi:MAG: DNA-binding protein [Rhodocyclales bacterium GT-UBC]|nr:MAG: DNA-binding protein [Rhodocyclales bacterium GT-UBC]
MESSGYQLSPSEFWKHFGIARPPILAREAPSATLRLLPGVLLTVAEAAARLHVSRATVYKLCEAGQLAHLRISTHAIRIPEASVAALLGNAQGATWQP